VADTSRVRRRFATSKAWSIAGRLVEAGEDTARTEAATAVAVVVATVEAETAAAVNTVAVATVAAATVAVGDTAVVVTSLDGPAAPICAATGNESVPASMARRRPSGSHA
jgi:hypothetical protein